MTITTAMANSFKQELLEMQPHQRTDLFKLLMIRTGHTGTYGKASTNVGTPGAGAPGAANVGTDAVAVSGGYADVGGIVLAGFAVTLDGDVAVLTFADPAALAGTTISADGAVIYNSSRAGRVVATFAFPAAPRSSTGGPFDINLPAADAANGLIRIGVPA